MTTSNTQQQRAKNYLIGKLSDIATSPASGIDGTARIKAAMMAAYLSGLPIPTEANAKQALDQLEVDFGIELRNNS